eukprot:TRINITY_DN67787_c3_g1_i5.p1 TRINITY_DN67787_c3_g1~~TRINITY_DN67787_c3_g1_i5.p1  ORF type:complete len:269 (+),score=20.39 TRINITY_DN67787_c3_g1_i5:398-1204(+)
MIHTPACHCSDCNSEFANSEETEEEQECVDRQLSPTREPSPLPSLPSLPSLHENFTPPDSPVPPPDSPVLEFLGSPKKKQKVEVIDLTADDDESPELTDDGPDTPPNTSAMLPVQCKALSPIRDVDDDNDDCPPLESGPAEGHGGHGVGFLADAAFRGNLFRVYADQFTSGRIRLSHRAAIRKAITLTYGHGTRLKPQSEKQLRLAAKRKTSAALTAVNKHIQRQQGKSKACHDIARGDVERDVADTSLSNDDLMKTWLLAKLAHSLM